MDAKLRSLPPLKRFRLLEKEKLKPKQQPETNLPAKKRKYCRDSSFITPETPITTICLPAKKRVWAFRPEFSPLKSSVSVSSSCFDLNVEYTPSPEKKPECEIQIQEEIQPVNKIDAEKQILFVTENAEDEEIKHVTEIDGEKEIDAVIEEEEEEEEDDGILCAVCESTDGDPSDPIVFCDGCDLMVHASCYGNPLIKCIPEGDWFCAQCSDSSPTTKKCCLCPITGGAMKPTSDGRWAHIICALLVPEVFFVEPAGREGIDCSNVPKRRWKEVCYVCKGRRGCAVECSELKCPLAFHVGCGLKEELCIELKERKYCGGIVAGFCKKHTELWKKQQQTGKFKIVARDEDKH